MEKEHTHKEIELRSEEVQEVMNRVPAWILRSGITVLFVIVVALVAGSYWFKYPDVIAAEVTVSTQDPPAYVVSRAAGRLENLYQNIEAEIERMNQALDMLKYKCWFYDQVMKGVSEDQLHAMIPDSMPEEIQVAYAHAHETKSA